MKVDTAAPVLSISGWPTSFTAGEAAQLTLTFSEDVGASLAWDAASQTGDLVVAGGSLGAIGNRQVLTDGRVQFSAVFTPQQGGAGSASVTMAAGQFEDAAGNVGNAVSLTADYSTLRPSVTGVALQGLDSLGAAKAGTLTPGDKVQVKVSFDDAIVHTVASNAAVGAKAGFALVLDNNALRLADYVSGSGTRVLVFEYVVGLGDLDRLGGIAAQANALVLPVGVSLQNAGGNEASLSTPVMAAGTNTLSR